MTKIISAETGEALEHFITLSQEYVRWMLAEIEKQYPELDRAELISEHAYDDVRKKFPGEHVAPDGCLLIAIHDNAVAGGIALARLSETICEVRTLFVRPSARGAGIGKALVTAVLHQAREFDYEYARLDTLGFMQAALTLYKSFGFNPIDPYLDVSASLQQYIRFLEMKL